MISDKVLVSDKENECEGLEAALEVVEKAATFNGFGEADAKTMRKLAEEMISGSAAIMTYFSGTMWAQTTEEGQFQILLEMEGTFTQEEREQLIALTKDNKNTLPKGFFGKLGVVLSDALSGEYFYPYGMTADPASAEVMWTSAELAEMMADMDRHEHDPEDKALREEAKQVLDTQADDVTVAARADHVLITVSKALPKQA